MAAFHGIYAQYTHELARFGHDYARTLWGNTNPTEWSTQVPRLANVMSHLQYMSATAGGNSIGYRLAEQGINTRTDWMANPMGLQGWASNGEPIEALVNMPGVIARNHLAQGGTLEQAHSRGGYSLDRIVSTQVMEAARTAQALEVSARTELGFMRMIQPGACDLCTVLAGRIFYGDHHTTAFLIHENCRCFMEPVVADQAAREHYLTAQQRAFDGLSVEEQNRIFGAANAAAIRDGGDMGQVVNARINGPRSGMSWGHARAIMGPGVQRRATVNELFLQSAGDRNIFRDLLQDNGYVRNADGTLSRPAGAQGQGQSEMIRPLQPNPLMDAFRRSLANRR